MGLTAHHIGLTTWSDGLLPLFVSLHFSLSSIGENRHYGLDYIGIRKGKVRERKGTQVSGHEYTAHGHLYYMGMDMDMEITAAHPGAGLNHMPLQRCCNLRA